MYKAIHLFYFDVVIIITLLGKEELLFYCCRWGREAVACLKPPRKFMAKARFELERSWFATRFLSHYATLAQHLGTGAQVIFVCFWSICWIRMWGDQHHVTASMDETFTGPGWNSKSFWVRLTENYQQSRILWLSPGIWGCTHVIMLVYWISLTF